MDGGANRGAAVDGDAQMKRRRNGGPQNREGGHDAIDGINHVRAGLAENGEKNGILAAEETQVAGVFDGIDDLRHIAKPNGGAGMTCNDEGLILVGFEKLIGVRDMPGFWESARAPLARFALAACREARMRSRLMP